MKYTLDESLVTKNDREKYVDKKFVNKEGLEYEVLGVHDAIGRNKRYVCLFTESGSEQLSYRSGLIKECVKDVTVDKQIGVEYETNKCGRLITTKRLNDQRFKYRFIDTGTVGDAYLINIQRGEVEDPYAPKVCGVGWIGMGIPAEHPRIYMGWHDLLERLYCKDQKNKFPHYTDVTLHREWLCFENFSNDYKKLLGWAESQAHPEISFDLDKDIRSPLRHYSPETCILIPHELNMLVTIKMRHNTTGYVGVSINKGGVDNRKYVVGLSKGHNGKKNARVVVGYSATLEDGFKMYSEAKREYLNELLSNKYTFLSDELKSILRAGLDRILEETLL